MKRLFFIVTLFLFSVSLSASNVSSSKGEESYEPKEIYYGARKGDFSLSFNALPVINFVGNMFNGTNTQSFSGLGELNKNSFSGSAISGKYFISDKMSFLIETGFNCFNNKLYAYEDNKVKDNIKNSGTNEAMFNLGMYYILRPGKLIQPIIGANLMYVFSNKNFEIEDDRTEINADINHKNPSNSFGLLCDVGIELFLSKTISLSAISNIGLITTTTRSKVNDWDEKYSLITLRQTRFMTGKMGGNFAINFYF